jgi:uncharacterized protein YjiS (DUF1127 family)
MDHTLSWAFVRHPATILRNLAAAGHLLRERRALAQLDTHLLRDIGIDDAARQAELASPLWDAPQGWRGR